MIVFYPSHVAKKLPDDAIVASRNLQFDHDQGALRINCEYVYEAPAHGEFDASNTLVVIEQQARLDQRQILSQKVSQITLVRKFTAISRIWCLSESFGRL